MIIHSKASSFHDSCCSVDRSAYPFDISACLRLGAIKDGGCVLSCAARGGLMPILEPEGLADYRDYDY